MIRDRDIRATLTSAIDQQHGGDRDALLISELGLCCGNARIDLALVNGSLNGYEIKSERDTLERLAGQEAVYSEILDTVTIVASGCHVDAIADSVPSWWGVTEARVDVATGRLVLVEIRAPGWNHDVNADMLVQLLWRDEVLEELEQRDLGRGLRSKPRRVLWEALSSSVSVDELRELVRLRLKSRSDWRSPSPPSSGGGSLRSGATS